MKIDYINNIDKWFRINIYDKYYLNILFYSDCVDRNDYYRLLRLSSKFDSADIISRYISADSIYDSINGKFYPEVFISFKISYEAKISPGSLVCYVLSIVSYFKSKFSMEMPENELMAFIMNNLLFVYNRFVGIDDIFDPDKFDVCDMQDELIRVRENRITDESDDECYKLIFHKDNTYEYKLDK